MKLNPIKTPADIEALNGYQKKVDPKKDEIASFVMPYFLRSLIKCAICGQKHFEGHIFKTISGSTSNMGHDCYKKFKNGADKYQQYKDNIIINYYKEKVISFKRDNMLSFKKSTQSLFDLYSEICRRKSYLKNKLPTLNEMLVKRAVRQDTLVTTRRERTNEEIEKFLAMFPGAKRDSARYVEDPEGHLIGLSIFRLYFNHEDIMDGLSQLEAEFAFAMSKKELKEWARWIDDVEYRFLEAKKQIDDSSRFFSKNNFDLFNKFDLPESEKAIIEKASPDSFGLEAINVSEFKPMPEEDHNQNRRPNDQAPSLLPSDVTRLMKHTFGKKAG